MATARRSHRSADGFAACFAPPPPGGATEAELDIQRFGLTTERVKAAVLFLAAAPAVAAAPAKPPPCALVLLTNGGAAWRAWRGPGKHHFQI